MSGRQLHRLSALRIAKEVAPCPYPVTGEVRVRDIDTAMIVRASAVPQAFAA